MTDDAVGVFIVREAFVGTTDLTASVLTVALAEFEGGEGRGLLFSRLLNDRPPGLRFPRGSKDPAPYSVSHHLGGTMYGGVLEFSAESSHLRFRVAPEFSRFFDCPELLDVHLRIPEAKAAEVAEALGAMLREPTGSERWTGRTKTGR